VPCNSRCKRSAAPHIRTIAPADVHNKYATPVRLSESAALLNAYRPAVSSSLCADAVNGYLPLWLLKF